MKIENLEMQRAKLLVRQRMEELHGKLFSFLVKWANGYDSHKIYKLLRRGYYTPALKVWYYEKYLIKHFGNKKEFTND